MRTKFYLLSFLLIPYLVQSQINIKGLLNESCDLSTGIEIDRQQSNRIGIRDLSDDLKNEFQAILDDEYAKSGAAGLSCAVILGDDEWKGVAGISSAVDSMNSEMVLGIGSLSKSIAAATVLKLEEEGKLNIEDKITKWLEKREFVDSSITIKQLLNHTSGIYNVTDNPKFAKMINGDFEKIWKPEEVLDTFLLEPYFAPGNGWHYSNSNYILIGMIVEKVTGKKYHEVVRDKILHPKGLDSIYLKPFESNSLDVAHFWADPFGGNNGIDITATGIELKSLFSGAWAAGAYMARPIDIAYWMKLLASGKVLNEKSQKELLTGVSRGDSVYYGLGVIYVVDDSGDIFVVGHDGNIGYTTKTYHFLKEDLTFAIQCNDVTVNVNTLDNVFKRVLLAYKSFVNSIELNNAESSLVIFPNPVSEVLTIDLSGSDVLPGKMRIYNEFGERIYSSSFDSKRRCTLDVSSYAKGLYFIKAGRYTSKFVVE